MSSVTVDGAPEGWVPVERRWLGFDRRTILPAVVVALVAVIMSVVIPAIDNAVPNKDRVRSGEVLQLGGGIQFTPITGWAVISGLRAGQPAAGGTYPNDATVQSGSVSFSVAVDSYTGTAAALLAKLRKTSDKLKVKGSLHVDAPTRSATTATGVPGVIARYGGSRADGIIAAFVTGKVGIEVVAVAGDGELTPQLVRDVATMIVSLRVVAGGAR